VWSLSNVACNHCHQAIEGNFEISIDVRVDPSLKDQLTKGDLFPHTCPHCGKHRPFDWIFLYWSQDWLGINLAASQPMTGYTAFHHVKHNIQAFNPNLENLPKNISVFGSMDELIYVIENPDCTIFRQYFRDILGRHWDGEINTLIQISDLFLKNNNPIDGFTTIFTTVRLMPDLYMHSGIKDALKLTAHACRNKTLEKYGLNTTPLDELNKLMILLEKEYPDISSQLDATVCYDMPQLPNNKFLPNSHVIIHNPSPSSYETLYVDLQICMWDDILFTQHNQRVPKHSGARYIYRNLEESQKDNVRKWFRQVYNLDVERYLKIDSQ